MRPVPSLLYALSLISACNDPAEPADSEIVWQLPDACDAATFEIRQRAPLHGATGVAIDRLPTVLLSAPIDPTSAIDAITVDGVTGTTVVNGRELTFVPDQVLPPDTLITVSVVETLRDQDGRLLAAPDSWQFTTRSTGRTFDAPVELAAPSSSEAIAVTSSLAAGPVVAWSHQRASGDLDELLARQGLADGTWTDPVRLDDTAVGPRLRSTQDGRTVMAFSRQVRTSDTEVELSSAVHQVDPCAGWLPAESLAGRGWPGLALDPVAGDAVILHEDGGLIATWIAADGSIGGDEPLFTGVTYREAVDVAGGRGIVAFEDEGGDGIVVRVRDGGAWTAPIEVPGLCSCDAAVAILPEGRALVAWRQSLDDVVAMIRHVDGTWSAPEQIYASDGGGLTRDLRAVRTAGGEVIVSWQQYAVDKDDAGGLGLRRWAPATGWGEVEWIDRPVEEYAIGADAAGRAVVVVASQLALHAAVEQPGGGFAIQAISSDGADGAPQVAVGPDGEVIAIWTHYDGDGLTLRSATLR